MKRILAIIAAVTMISVGMTAQTRALATLSHEGQLTFFDKVSAFEDAVEAAVDGDIIYLSDGKFGASQQSITIQNKKISIVGNGYNSHIICDVKFDFMSDQSEIILSAPLFDGVRLEILEFGDSYGNRSVQNVEIRKCMISEFKSMYADNILLDRCRISTYNGDASNANIRLCNCKIGSLGGRNCEIIENCNINDITSDPSYVVNSIITRPRHTTSSITYENCIFGTSDSAPNSEIRNCYDLGGIYSSGILDENLECNISDMSSYIGTDGTVVGIYGGEWFPYSETPSVPTVDSANSSVEYDKENNQLKVTITVAPN